MTERNFGISQQDLSKDNPLRTVLAHSEVHVYSDLDQDLEAQHHSLGPGEYQGAPGNHRHLRGTNITGDRSDGTALVSVIAALVKLGATDQTVA